MRRRLKPLLLLALVVGGGVSGYSIAHYFRSFTAEIAVPVDPLSYRSVEGMIGSAEDLKRYATATGKLQSPEFKLLESQFLSLGEGAVKFESTQRLKKRDLRDLPDQLVKRMLEPEESKHPMETMIRDGKVLDAVVTATRADREAAARLARFASDYLRHALMLSALREHLLRWGPQGRNDLAKAIQRITGTEAKIAGLDQRIASMKELRERYKDFPQDMLGSTSSNVQVVAGTKVLSPAQQLIGFEADRIESVAEIRGDRITTAYLTLLIEIADEFLPRLESGQSPLTLIKEIRTRISGRAQPNDQIEQLALSRARAAVDVSLAEIERDYAAAAERPHLRKAGIRGSIAAIFGALLGLLIWFGSLFFRRGKAALERLLAENLS